MITKLLHTLKEKLPQFESLNECELIRSLKLIDHEKITQLTNLIVASLDMNKSNNQIGIKLGIFGELDVLRARYEALDLLMSEKLNELSEEIYTLPDFMKKLRMMMIPSVGYFTVVSKSDQMYLDFLKSGLASN